MVDIYAAIDDRLDHLIYFEIFRKKKTIHNLSIQAHSSSCFAQESRHRFMTWELETEIVRSRDSDIPRISEGIDDGMIG